MTTLLPVVFLAFANDDDDFLKSLKEESRDVFKVLQPLQANHQIAIHREESVEFDELFDDLLAYNDRVVIFHYAGHANGSSLKLEGGAGGAGGIANLLGQQKSLKLVFLNGCATKDQVTLLHQAGVPAIIATSVKIADNRARKLSEAFYAALAKGESIVSAFDIAKAYVEGKFPQEINSSLSTRGFNQSFAGLNENSRVDFEFEWTLYVRPDAVTDIEQWRLPAAQQSWQIQLKDKQTAIRDFADEPVPFTQIMRSRTVDIQQCASCGIHYTGHADSHKQCILCGSSELSLSKTQTAIPDLDIPFSINQQQATEIARSCLDASNVNLANLSVPFWLFEFDTRTFINAERGMLTDLDQDTPKLQWQPVKEQIDMKVSGLLVPASSLLNFSGGDATAMADKNWLWDLEQALKVNQLGQYAHLVPLDVQVQQAFELVVDWLDSQLEMDIPAKLGGLERRNITTDRRYSNLKVSSISLPYWSAYLPPNHEKQNILINGQTGAFRFTPLPAKHALKNESSLAMNNTQTSTESTSNKASNLVSIFSGLGIGIMIGMLMGLAAPQGAEAKSVVAIFIGAVGVGLAALLGLNDRHFSTAKGLRIGSFGLAVTAAALIGIYVRDNALLTPTIDDRAQLLRQAFPEMDSKTLMAVLTQQPQTEAQGTPSEQNTQQSQFLTVRSALFSADGLDRSICAKLQISEQTDTADVLRTFRYWDDDGKLGWKNLANTLVENYSSEDQKQLLFIARDGACGFIPGSEPIDASLPACKLIQAQSLSRQQLNEIFSKSAELAPILQLVNEKISEQGRTQALTHLAPVLCSDSQLNPN